MTAFALVLRGEYRVGRTAVAQALAARFGGIHISVDEVLVSYGLDEYDSDGIPLHNFVRANVLAMPVARHALAAGRPVVFDGSFHYEEQMEHLVQSLMQTTDLATPPIIVTLIAPLEIFLVAPGEGGRAHSGQPQASAGVEVERTVVQVLTAIAPHLPAPEQEPAGCL